MQKRKAFQCISFGISTRSLRTHFSSQELQPFVDALDQPGATKAMLGSYRAVFTQALKDGFRIGGYPAIDREVLFLFAREEGSYQELIPGTEKYAPRMTVKGFDHCGKYLHAELPAEINNALLEFLVKGSVELPKRNTGEMQTEWL